MHTEEAYLSTREAAEILGISLRTAQLWVESGVLLAWKTSGGHRRILRNSVDSLLEERQRITPPIQDTKTTTLFKIAIVEDDIDQSRLMQMALTDLKRSTEIRIARDGFTGLVLIGEFKPHLVIADLNMPGIDGFRLIQSLIGSEFSPEKIIVSTALSPPDIEARGGLPDSVEILQKPYLLEELEAKILPLLSA